jgi:hypothetical protein
MLFRLIVNKLTATFKNLLVSEERIYVKLIGYELYKCPNCGGVGKQKK